MQNCNISPDVMMVDSPMTPDKFPDYIFNQPAHTTHQRATRAAEALSKNDRMTVEDIIELALDRKVYQYERWVAALNDAQSKGNPCEEPDCRAVVDKIRAWDGISNRDSNGALVYYYWKRGLIETSGQDRTRELTRRVNNYLDLFGVPGGNGRDLNAEDYAAMNRAVKIAAETMRNNHGSLDAVFGDVFRAGRLDYDGDDVSYPVGGGSFRDEAMSTVRAIGFTAPRKDHTRWGTKGQTSTEVVIMTNPIQSYTQPPIGQSDHPDSPHFRDQAEKLLSAGKMKPSWFQKEDLLNGHVRSTVQVEYTP